MAKTQGPGKGKHPNSLENLKKGYGHLATKPAEYAKKGSEVRRRRGIIRRAALEALENGFISIDSKDAEILDHAGNKMDIDFGSVRLKVPNHTAIGMKLMQEAVNGNMKAHEILISLDENYKNREIKARNKQAKASQSLAEHLEHLTVTTKTIDIPVTNYEELGREVE